MSRDHSGLYDLEMPCTSETFLAFGGKRAIVTVDAPFADIIQNAVKHLIVRGSQGSATGHIPVVSYYYVDGHALSMSRLLFNKRWIKRVVPLATKKYKTFYFNESMDNFCLSADTKYQLLQTNPGRLPAYVLRNMTTMGHLLEEVGPDRFKRLMLGLHQFDTDRNYNGRNR